jgi:hypothetical protein
MRSLQFLATDETSETKLKCQGFYAVFGIALPKAATCSEAGTLGLTKDHGHPIMSNRLQLGQNPDNLK